MSFLLAGQNVTMAEVYQHRFGDWQIDVSTDSAIELTGSVTLTLNDISFTGTIVPNRGGVSGSVGRYRIRGALPWDAIVTSRPYRTEAGVRLRTVIDGCAQDAGEADARARGLPASEIAAARGVFLATVDMPDDAQIGTAFHRRAGAARETLSALRSRALIAAWYVTPAGRTIFEERPAPTITEPAAVTRRDLAAGVRYLGVERLAPFVPGGVFEGKTVDSVIFRVGRSIEVDLWAV